jgi:hypothetical protein
MLDMPRREKRGAWAALALWLVLLPLGYVLSVGPVARLVLTDALSMHMYWLIYRPFEIAEQESEVARHALESYRGLFADELEWTVREDVYRCGTH